MERNTEPHPAETPMNKSRPIVNQLLPILTRRKRRTSDVSGKRSPQYWPRGMSEPCYNTLNWRLEYGNGNIQMEDNGGCLGRDGTDREQHRKTGIPSFFQK